MEEIIKEMLGRDFVSQFGNNERIISRNDRWYQELVMQSSSDSREYDT